MQLSVTHTANVVGKCCCYSWEMFVYINDMRNLAQFLPCPSPGCYFSLCHCCKWDLAKMIFSFPIDTEILLWALGESPSPWCADTMGAWSVKFEPTWQTGTSPSFEMVLGRANQLTDCYGQESHCHRQWERRVASICLNRQILDTWRVGHRLCSSELLTILTLCQCPPLSLLRLLSVLFRALCCVLTFAFFESCRERITHCFPTWKMPIMKLNAVGFTFTRSWMASQGCHKPVGSLYCPERVCFLKQIDFPSESTWKQSFSALTILQVLVQNLMNVLMCNARMLLGNLWELNEERLSISGRASKFSFAVLLLIIII